MLSLKSFAPFLLSMVFATSSHAVTVLEVVPWDSESSTSSVFYKSAGSDNTMLFSASISHSKEGSQRLYFAHDSNFGAASNLSTSNDDIAHKSNVMGALESILGRRSPISTVIVVNGQAIKMLGFVKQYSDSMAIYLSYTPETEAGHNYLINLFKKSKVPIEVDFRGEKIYIPAAGFTKAWNNHGGNAI